MSWNKSRSCVSPTVWNQVWKSLWYYLLISLVIGFSKADKLQAQCPWTCQCKYENNGLLVQCPAQYWKTIPPLPHNTSILHIHDAKISELTDKIFYNAHGQNLTMIIFSQVLIQRIYPNTFYDLNNLISLSINRNSLEDIPDGIFTSKLEKLNYVRLSKGHLKKIPDSNICSLAALQHLILSENNISYPKFHDCFKNNILLNEISLNANPLYSITNETFYALRTLKIRLLYLNSCKLKTLDKNIFQYLHQLTTLDLGNNKFTHIEPETFSYTPYLQDIFLQENLLQTVPNDILSTSRLKSLNLKRNNITNLNISTKFLNKPYFHMLDVSSNPIKRLYNNTFKNLINSTLKLLVISQCKLEYIEAGTFSPLQHLEELTLSSNPLTAEAMRLTFFGLQNANALKTLTIMGTHLKNLDNTTFQYLKNSPVQKLLAQQILTKVIRPKSFHFLTNVNDINLIGCGITEIEENAFTGLPYLSHLELDNNKLTDLPSAYKTGLTKLKALKIQNNPISYLTSLNCKDYFALESLNAHQCDIRHITKNTFQDMRNLSYLNLSQNKIGFIDKTAFVGLSNLKTLKLQRNNLLILTPKIIEMFLNTPRLQKLDLSFTAVGRNSTLVKKLLSPLQNLTSLLMPNTGIHEIPPGIFNSMKNLQELSLSGNDLSNWSPEVFKNLTSLNTLILQNNKISLINQTSFTYLKSLRELDLSRNPFACTCDLLWFKQWIYSTIYIIDLGPNYKCQSPPKMSNTPVQNYRPTLEECSDLTAVYIMLSIILFYAVTVTLTSLLYRYRWYIRYWLYLLKSRKRLQADRNDATAYVFDAFISYCGHDQGWVVEELLPQIEYEANIRLCLHDRNWLGGRLVEENIAESINRSRKTVLVVSNNFMKSFWCEIELSLAQHELFARRLQDPLVVVLLENIEAHLMTAQMKSLLTTKTYIQWPKHHHKRQIQFWKLLRKVLTPVNPVYEEDPDAFVPSQPFRG